MQDQTIHGLEIAVKSMFIGEISQFIIAPKYGFGKFPPRGVPVPEQATLVYEIELISCTRLKQFVSFFFQQQHEIFTH